MMRIKKFKWGNPLFVILLACAGLFGVTSLTINNGSADYDSISPAHASGGYTGGEIVYVVDKNPKFDDCDCRLNIWGHDHGTLSEVATFAFRFEEASGTNYIVYGLKIPDYTFGDGGSWDYFKMLRYKREWASDTGYVPEHAYNESYQCSVSDYKSYSTWWTEAWEGGNFAVGKSNTFTNTTTGDTAMVFRFNTDSGYVDGCKVALHYGGYGISRTVDVEVIGNYLRAATIPAGITAFQLLRVNQSLALPIDGYPDSFYHNNQFVYDSSKNMVTISKYSGSEYGSAYAASDKTLVPKGTTYIYCNEGSIVSDWFADNRVPFFVSWPASTDYYGGYTQWLMMTRVGMTQYMTVTTDRTLCMADYAYTRNQNGWTGWENVTNQTTDITINRTGGLVCAIGTASSGKINWKGTTEDSDYANYWGARFVSCVTCDGSGSVTGGSSGWSSAESDYNALTSSQKTELLETTGVISGGTYAETAIYRYDYIIHKYGTATYDDFINRLSGTGTKYPYNAANIYSPFSLLTEDENNLSTVIIVVASSVALLSVTALSILVIKKRKNKEQ